MKKKFRRSVIATGAAVMGISIVLILYWRGCDTRKEKAVNTIESSKQQGTSDTIKITVPSAESRIEKTASVAGSDNKKGIKGIFDNFTGPVLSKRWFWNRENRDAWSLNRRPGYLLIVSDKGDLWEPLNNSRNTLLMKTGYLNFQIDTKVTIRPAENFHQAGIIVYSDDDNYVKLVRIQSNGSKVELLYESEGHSAPVQVYCTSETVYLRLIRKDGAFSGYYSVDGIDFSPVGEVSLNAGDDLKVGLISFNNNATDPVDAYFDYFYVVNRE